MARNRILVVEDDESISRVIVRNLQATGYDVHACMELRRRSCSCSTEILIWRCWM